VTYGVVQEGTQDLVGLCRIAAGGKPLRDLHLEPYALLGARVRNRPVASAATTERSKS
jgi:hypothetical protein